MGKQISPSLNPKGVTYETADGDYNQIDFQNNGTLDISGILNNGGILRNNGGSLGISHGSSLSNNDGGKLINDGSLVNYGNLLNNQGGMLTHSSGTIENNGILSNSGVFNINTGCNLDNLTNYLTNERTGTITNDGHITTLWFVFTNYGLIQGTGHTGGDIVNHGTINGGKSVGGYLIDGNLYQRDGSLKLIELGGTYHGDGDRTATEHDWIEITGNLELAGKLDVSLIDGFKLSGGDSFVITKVDGDLSGQYDGLDEGDSVGRFKSDNGGTLDLFVTYQGGDGNDIELYTKSAFGVLPNSLSDTRIIGSDEEDSLTGTNAHEVMHGGNGDDVLLGGGGDDQVTGGNGNDKLYGGLGDDTLKGDRGADTYKLSSGNDVIDGFSFAENDRISVADGVDLSFKQVGDDLLLTADGIHTTLLDVDKGEFLAADVIDYI
ncbi:calcium-binding protein [Prochlorococcus sp. MIT 1303]|uniref:calcium-binding protein n=1 Tax=Prochlorococcus sp. MIT 1303 TaxID=1723647 RepID=UPI0007BB4D2F|nr:hypothetical protein [Prochlorococcus sp. MIT 1303]KZR67931.1 Poly(beta-D-mannuronate) C5 epimerase 7 [Prochlorococcus sp. MIT 1303]